MVSFFPANWKHLARLSGALKGLRQDKSEENLIRVLMLHVGCGFSMRETVVRAKQANLADLSAVALLRVCHEISVPECQLVIAVRLNIYERLMIHL